MFKEIFIFCYLLSFKAVFNIFKLFPQKNKITLVVSFEENPAYVFQELLKRKVPYEIIILSKETFSEEFEKELKMATIIPFETYNIIHWIQSIYHLSTSRWLIIDNYYGFLSTVHFKENVECIQIWHAAGALKTFGLQDHSVEFRSKAAKKRFRKVYEKFDKVVVGSEVMASIFMDSFDLSPSSILRTGVPRTDFFFEKENHETLVVQFREQFPKIKGKKVILYAPTFRDSQFEDYEIKLDLDRMYQQLNKNHVLFIKLHPAVKAKYDYQKLYPDFVYDLTSYKRMNEFLVITDILITDYSSTPFEFALLKKPMIFYTYDLELYKKERGVISNFEQEVPGPLAFDTNEVIKLILNSKTDIKLICEFSHTWNKYSDGSASKKLVDYIVNKDKRLTSQEF
ncbi:CDP-glycerol glycerophosphotransferase family protein [Neobacillus niacini]|uniref:CDP-glycerol glycerophosphotransferase family protein n=1 Tax=Neobacillus niacini TaxID=86668 RepID=UPI003982E285